MPLPRSRSRAPLDVPGGILTLSLVPSGVGTSTLAPPTAAAAPAEDLAHVGAAAEELAENLLGLSGIDVHAAARAAAGEAPVEAAAALAVLKPGLRPGKAEAVVLGALLLVAHNVVGIL